MTRVKVSVSALMMLVVSRVAYTTSKRQFSPALQGMMSVGVRRAATFKVITNSRQRKKRHLASLSTLIAVWPIYTLSRP